MPSPLLFSYTLMKVKIMKKSQIKHASKAIDRITAPLQEMEEIELAMDGSGDCTSIIAGHFSDAYERILKETAAKFGVTPSEIAQYEVESQDRFMDAVLNG